MPSRENDLARGGSSDSGYTTSPTTSIHNNVLQQQQSSGSSGAGSNGSSSNSAALVLTDDVTKNSNLLANIPVKDDVGSKANNINTNTIGRTGTLCKKVYL